MRHGHGAGAEHPVHFATVSVESGLGAPVDRAAAAPSAAGGERARSRVARRGPARTEALADAVSTPARAGRARPRPQARRVRRVVRRIELWSVLKISLVFNTVMLGVVLGAVAILWGLANTTGLVEDLEGFLRDSGFEDFRFQGDRMFRKVAFIGAVGSLAFTVFIVLATALVNLISEVTGGIRFIVLEEILEDDPVAPPSILPAEAARPAPRPPAPPPEVGPPRAKVPPPKPPPASARFGSGRSGPRAPAPGDAVPAAPPAGTRRRPPAARRDPARPDPAAGSQGTRRRAGRDDEQGRPPAP